MSSMTAPATASGSPSVIVRAAGPATTSSKGPLSVTQASNVLDATHDVAGRYRLLGASELSQAWAVGEDDGSSKDSRSSGLISTAAGDPFRVIVTRSCSRWTRSTNSERRSRTVRNGSVLMAQIVPRGCRQPRRFASTA